VATASLAQGKVGLRRALLTLAVTGSLRVVSPPGAGTVVTAEMPCES
jgi:hypothetical protein